MHYTACNCARAIEILTSPERQVSAHFLLDTDGTVFELVPCLEGSALKAWHAGKSTYTVDGVQFENLNSCALGIEIVNLNGNLLPYSEAQYKSLELLVRKLQNFYPNLSNPARIIGHEHIAGYRGKTDPGIEFNWARLFNSLFPGDKFPTPHSICPPAIVAEAKAKVAAAGETEKGSPEFWIDLSTWFERSLAAGAAKP